MRVARLSSVWIWTKLGLDLLIGAMGAFLGGTCGAFLKSYSELKGQHLATFENIGSLLAQERGRAYEGERGKQLATHEDIENVRKDIRVITKETETIKAQIGTDAWTRQMVWNQKRDSYREVMKCTNDHLESLKTLHAFREGFWRGAKRLQLDPSKMAAASKEVESQVADQMRAYADSHRDLNLALMEAHIFIDRRFQSLLDECFDNHYFGQSFGRLDHRPNLERTEQEQATLQGNGVEEMKYLTLWLGRIVAVAREDLGVDPMRDPSSAP